MAEASYFWTTNGTGDGTSGGYTATNFSQYLEDVTITAAASEGVLFGVDNSLAVSTTGVTRQVSIASGSAIVNGKFYKSDSAVLFTLDSTPSSRVDRVILRGNYSAQTVRLAILKGTDGSASPTALTQSDGTTWEILLANVSLNSSNVLSITDQRTFVKSPTAYGWFNTPLTLNSTLNVSGSITTTSDLTVNGGDIRLGADVDLRRSAANTLTIDDTVRIEHTNDGASGLFVINGSTGASADARLIAEVSSSASSDPFAQFRVRDAGNIVTYWTIGLDNSDSDRFKIVPAINLGAAAAAINIDPTSNLVSLSSLSTSSGTITNATLGTATITTLSGTGIVNSDNIASGAVVNAKLGSLAVDAAKIAANAVTSAKLAADAVVTTSINDNAVTSAKLAAGAVVTTSIAANVVTSAKLASYSVVTTSVATNAITSVELAANAIVTTSITANVVTSAKLAADAVVTTSIANLAVTNAKIANSAVDSAQINVGAVTTLKIAQYNVDGDRIGDWAPYFGGREGGNAGSWNVAGTTSYTNPITLSGSTNVNRVAMYAGTCSITLSGAASGTTTVTFNDRYTGGNKYAANPIIIANGLNTQDYLVDVVSTTVNDAVIRIQHRSGTTASGTFSVMWMAIGPSSQV